MYALPSLQQDYDVVMAAVQEDGRALEYTPPSLQGNPAIVHAAVLNDGFSLKWASADLKANKDLVLSVMCTTTYSTSAFRFADYSLTNDYDCVTRALAISRDIDPGWLPESGSWEDGPRRVLPFISQNIEEQLREDARQFVTFGDARTFLTDSLWSHASFMEFLLCTKSKLTPPEKPPPVTLLTSEDIHHHIAEYAGVPLGHELVPVPLAKQVMPILAAVTFSDEDNLAWCIREAGNSRWVAGSYQHTTPPFYIP